MRGWLPSTQREKGGFLKNVYLADFHFHGFRDILVKGVNPGAAGYQLLQADSTRDHLGCVACGYCQPGSALPTARINKVPARECNTMEGGGVDRGRLVGVS